MRKFIIVEVDDEDSAEPGFADVKEALFNFGIGAPENDIREGLVEWPNNKGYAYKVQSIRITYIPPQMIAPEHVHTERNSYFY